MTDAREASADTPEEQLAEEQPAQGEAPDEPLAEGTEPSESEPSESEPSESVPPESEPPESVPPSEPAQSPLSASPAGDDRLFLNLIAALIICASAVMVMWNLQTRSKKNSNTGSRYATIEAIVDYGTFAIDDSVYNFTIDKVKVDGHYYSSKPPTLPTYGAGIYWAYQKLTGKRIATDEGDVLWVIGMGTGWLTHVVLLIYFFKLAQLLFRRRLAQIGSLIALAFGCLSVAFATTLNNHSFGACLAFATLYHCVCVRQQRDRWWHWVACGLYAGFLPAIDLPSGLISMAAFGLLAQHDWRRALLWFAPATLPGLSSSLILSYISSGSVVPVYMRSELYKYAGSYWNHRGGIDSLREPKHIYAFHALLGHHGLFSMTPLFCFSLVGFYYALRRRAAWWWESLAVASVVVVTVVFYIVRTRNYGGWSVGMRWFVPLMPLLMFYFGVWLERVKLEPLTVAGSSAFAWLGKLWWRARWVVVVLAFGVGAFHVQDGMTSPFQFSRWHNWLDGKPNRNRQAAKLNLGKADREALRQSQRKAPKARKKPPKKRPKRD